MARRSATSAFIFNWYSSGDKEPTRPSCFGTIRTCMCRGVRRRHISAYETKRNGPVSKDDCVEIFISPNPNKVTNYYTFEINAIGTMLNRARTDWYTAARLWIQMACSIGRRCMGSRRKTSRRTIGNGLWRCRYRCGTSVAGRGAHTTAGRR